MILGTHTFEDSWNPVDEKEFNVLCSQTLSRTVPCITNDYTCDEEIDEDGNVVQVNVDTSETNWEDVYAENDYRTPIQLISLFRNYLSNELTGNPPVSKAPSFLEHLMRDCNEWIEDETIIMEDY